MTRGEIRARILHAVNEDVTNPVFVTTAEVDAIIDEAAEVLAEEAHAVKRTVFVPLQEGTAYYSTRGIAEDVMAIYRIWLQDENRRLDAVTMDELDRRHRTWETVTGDPEVWFPVSWDLFGLWPSPSTGGGILRVDYYAWPRALLHDADVSELPEADHEALVLYGVYEIAAKRWDEAMAFSVWNEFLRSWLAARDRAGAKQLQAKLFQLPPTGEAVGFRTFER